MKLYKNKMGLNKNKKKTSKKGKRRANISDEEEANNKSKKMVNDNYKQRVNKSDKDANHSVTAFGKQDSDNEGKTFQVTNEIMPAILERLKILERLHTIHDKKVIKNTDSDNTDNDTFKRNRKKEIVSKKKIHKNGVTSDLEIDNTSDEDSVV